MVEELEPLLSAHLGGVTTNRLRSYPSPRDLTESVGSGSAVVFLDVSSDGEQAFQLLTEVVRLGSTIQIVALLPGNDPDLILRCLRGGAAEFLIQPFTSDQLQAALQKLSRLQPAEGSGKEPGKILAVMPAKGACGATTIACNLAFQWQRLHGGRILLADLDPLTGTLSFLLKIKSIYSFLDALQRSQELDDDLWNTMVTEVHG